MKIYEGYRDNEAVGGQSITVKEGDKTYPLRHHVRHSPDGFQWGYGGSGPADTALSILCDYFNGDVDRASKFYQSFKFDFIATAKNKLRITSRQISSWLKIEKKRRSQ